MLLGGGAKILDGKGGSKISGQKRGKGGRDLGRTEKKIFGEERSEGESWKTISGGERGDKTLKGGEGGKDPRKRKAGKGGEQILGGEMILGGERMEKMGGKDFRGVSGGKRSSWVKGGQKGAREGKREKAFRGRSEKGS